MCMWLLWTGLLTVILSGAHAVAGCAQASWLLPNQVQQLPRDMLKQTEQMQRLQQELWPQCAPVTVSDTSVSTVALQERQNLAMCKEVDSLLENLQNSWQALHQHSQACSILGLSNDNSPCTLDAPTIIPKTATALQQPQHAAAQHQQWHSPYAQQGVQAAAASMCLSHSTQTAELAAVHHCAGNQQHLLPSALGPATDQNNPSFAAAVAKEWSVGSMLWGCQGWLLDLHRIWEHLMHDTQVVQQQLENEAQIGGQACRSCLAPHLHKSHREVVLEVVALLVLGALCASGLLLAATFYRRHQSTRRYIQHSIATQRQKHFEKLQQQQQQQLLHRQQEAMLRSDLRHTQLSPLLHTEQHSPAVTVKHSQHRSKASEPAIPSSPSASSSHSEAIGTQVRQHSRPDKADKPERARSARRSQNFESGSGLHQGLGRSRSDISTEAANLGHDLNFQNSDQSVHSIEGPSGSLLAGSVHGAFSSEPSTPSSVAGSATSNPFQTPSDHLPTPLGSSETPWRAPPPFMDGSVDSKHATQTSAKKKSRHNRKAAKKVLPAKRRFIPGLDSKFDPLIHELPTPPQDPSPDQPKQKGTVESVGSRVPSSSPLPPAVHYRRQLSVDAPVFKPTGYAQLANFGPCSGQFPNQCPVSWQIHAPTSHVIGHASPDSPYQFLQPGPSEHAEMDSALSPRRSHTSASSSSSSSFSSFLNRTSPVGRPLYHGDSLSSPSSSLLKPRPRHSPTSVLRCHFTPAEYAQPLLSGHNSISVGTRATAQDRPPQLGFVDSPRGWGLPPLLEEGLGSPFPGMSIRATQDAFHSLLDSQSPSADILSAANSAASHPSVEQQSHVGVASSLPGFSSIWSTSKAPARQDTADNWQMAAADKPSSIW
ncbi:hypothetical protein WJX77_001582 [Trebouxia sp. C0004]